MNIQCKEFVEYINTVAPKHDKRMLEDDMAQRFHLIKDRKVYHSEYFAVRVSYSKCSSESFSNTVLSLSMLEKYDRIPFFVILVRQCADNLILLANTTLLKKVSHSSQHLSMTNIRGSFNGSDIIRDYNGTPNTPVWFDYLFAIHQSTGWEENLARLVEASTNIRPGSPKFAPTSEEKAHIIASVDRAVTFVASSDFKDLERDLNERCAKVSQEILIASHIENVNIRGRLIESLIVTDGAERERIVNGLHDMEQALPTYDVQNGLGDYHRRFANEDTYTDIKTKIVYLNSNPKAYNIDKFLRQMSDTRSVLLFYFIGIDRNNIFNTLLCSVYHAPLIEGTILQYHWAGRNSRGAAQFHGATINRMLNEEHFQNNINKERAQAFLADLLKR